MMTETEAMGYALAKALRGNPKSFGSDQAKIALTTISALVKSGKLADDEADGARVRLGNHSAIRQHLVAHGLLAIDDDALSTAIKLETGKMDANEDRELEKLSSSKA